MRPQLPLTLLIALIVSVPHLYVAEGQAPTPNPRFAFERVWPDSLIGKGFNVFTLVLSRNGALFAGTAFNGLWKSPDSGKTWSRVTTIGDDVVLDLLCASNGDLFSIGTNLYRSKDDGETWERIDGNPATGLPSLIRGKAIAQDPQDYLYLGVSNEGAWKSNDSGNTWSLISNGLPRYQRRVPPYDTLVTPIQRFAFAENSLFVCTGAVDFHQDLNGIYRSTDGGNSWSSSFSGISSGHPLFAITVSRGTILAGGPLYNVRGIIPQRGIWRSVDGGRSWQLSYFDRAVLVLKTAPNGDVYAGDNDWKGVYRTTDLGTTWEYVGLDGYGVMSMFFLDDSTFLVGTNDGVFKGHILPAPANRPPILFLSEGNRVVYRGVRMVRDYLVTDPDGDPVTVSLDYTVSPSWLTVNTTNRQVAGTVPLEWGDGTSFLFKLVASDGRGGVTSVFSPAYFVATVVKVEDAGGVPREFALAQNFPNPFNPTTTIEFSLPTRSLVKLTIHDLLGREVAIVVEGELDPGVHRYHWSASRTDRSDRSDGVGIPSGIYFYRLEAGGFVQTRKMILLY